jgi:hypothetical protein
MPGSASASITANATVTGSPQSASLSGTGQ